MTKSPREAISRAVFAVTLAISVGMTVVLATTMSSCTAPRDAAQHQSVKTGTSLKSDTWRSFSTFSIGKLPAGFRLTKAEKLKVVPYVDKHIPVICPPDAPAAERLVLRFEAPFAPPSREGRYWFPAVSHLSVYDLRGSDQRSFPTLWGSLVLLKRVLADRPTATELHTSKYNYNRAVFPPRNAKQQFHVKLRYIDAEWGSGYMVLTQFSQDGGSPANNEEMCCLFQGLAKGETHYLTGSFRVTQRGLPNLFDQIDESREKGDYSRDVGFLRRQTDDSFYPNLIEMRQMFESIRLK